MTSLTHGGMTADNKNQPSTAKDNRTPAFLALKHADLNRVVDAIASFCELSSNYAR